MMTVEVIITIAEIPEEGFVMLKVGMQTIVQKVILCMKTV